VIRAPLFVTAAPGTTDLLAAELAAFGIEGAREMRGGVACEAGLTEAYRACLESRTGLRVLWQVGRFPADDADALYAGVRGVDWSLHMDAAGTLAVDFSGSLAGVTHTQFGAQRVKDAVVDQFREREGRRPSVELDSPSLRIHAHAARRAVTVSIDLSGDSLHRRGYRGGQGAAPLKENLAAAILLRAGWPAIAAAGGSFVDPMCGSGTLPIEAALIAADIAPGLLRGGFGLERWRQHDPDAWAAVRTAAERRRQLALLTPGQMPRPRVSTSGSCSSAANSRSSLPRMRRPACWRSTRPTGSGSAGRRNCGRFMRSSVSGCVRITRAGKPRCSPATSRSAASSGSGHGERTG
jgi:23S rRNA (guanine2445-N2)-methyltransferase / 23S rRNA (guanine2069-N7)-methyltransferase